MEVRARLVADIVAGGVDLEQLGAALLVHAQQDGHHRQRPHVRVLHSTGARAMNTIALPVYCRYAHKAAWISLLC